MQRAVHYLTAILLVVGFGNPVFAATATQSASVNATVPTRTSLTLARDTNSVTARGSATQVVFNQTDDQDMGASGSAAFMYAPYRSETGKNWHIAQIIANGASMSLSAAVANGTGGNVADNLYVWSGGFYGDGATTPIQGTDSTNWEFLNGWERALTDRGFIGVVPFNYRLNIAGLAGGTHTANITFTLVAN